MRQLRDATTLDRLLSKGFFADRRNELTVDEGCLLWGIRVIVPKSLREKLFQELHQDHPGATRMKSVARSCMWWPGLDK